MLKIQVIIIPSQSPQSTSSAINSIGGNYYGYPPSNFSSPMAPQVGRIGWSPIHPQAPSPIYSQDGSIRRDHQKFLHITELDKSMLEVAQEIAARYHKLYPEEK